MTGDHAPSQMGCGRLTTSRCSYGHRGRFPVRVSGAISSAQDQPRGSIDRSHLLVAEAIDDLAQSLGIHGRQSLHQQPGLTALHVYLWPDTAANADVEVGATSHEDNAYVSN